MSWETSDRRQELPPDWAKRVARVKDRDGNRCTWRLPSGARCPRRGTDVDHRVPGDDHSLRNLQLLCSHHHKKKTGLEAIMGRRKRRAGRQKRQEKHPGLL